MLGKVMLGDWFNRGFGPKIGGVMPVIDAHVHIYPEKIASRAVDSVKEFYRIPMANSAGTLDELFSVCEGSPISHFLLLPVAAKASNVEATNTFIAQKVAENESCFGMMCIHQDYETLEAEVARAKSLGLRGIKIHPDMQRCAIDDERFMRMYEVAQAQGMPIVIHTGDFRTDFSHPRLVKRILHAFPDLTVCAAHFGAWSLFDIGADWLRDEERCFVDTSSAIGFVGVRHARELINMYGLNRVMFGSDYPMWSPVAELDYIDQMRFTPREYEAITWENAMTFLGL